MTDVNKNKKQINLDLIENFVSFIYEIFLVHIKLKVNIYIFVNINCGSYHLFLDTGVGAVIFSVYKLNLK